jgi:hypothetical protein
LVVSRHRIRAIHGAAPVAHPREQRIVRDRAIQQLPRLREHRQVSVHDLDDVVRPHRDAQVDPAAPADSRDRLADEPIA